MSFAEKLSKIYHKSTKTDSEKTFSRESQRFETIKQISENLEAAAKNHQKEIVVDELDPEIQRYFIKEGLAYTFPAKSDSYGKKGSLRFPIPNNNQ